MTLMTSSLYEKCPSYQIHSNLSLTLLYLSFYVCLFSLFIVPLTEIIILKIQ